MSESDKTTPRRDPESVRIGKTVGGITPPRVWEKSADAFRKRQRSVVRRAVEREYGSRAHYEKILGSYRASVPIPPVGHEPDLGILASVGRESEIALLASSFGSPLSTMRSGSGLLLPADSEPLFGPEEAGGELFSGDRDDRPDWDDSQPAPASKKEIIAGVLVSSFGVLLSMIAVVVGIVYQVPLVIWLPVVGVSSILSAISWLFSFKAWQYRKGFRARLRGIAFDLSVCSDILTRDSDLTSFGENEQHAVESVIADARLVRDGLFASGDDEEANVLGDHISDVLFSLDDAMHVAAVGASD